MWLLDNDTPFAVDRNWTRDEHGAEVWMVAIKASFEVDPDGKQTVLKAQAPVNLAPLYADDPDEMLDDTDFNMAKPRTDILVAGHAYAAGGRPAAETSVRLKVADVDKTVEVKGDRVFVPGPVSTTTSRPEAFLKVPLSWRRSFGGRDAKASKPDWDQRNPVGTGYAAHPSHLVGKSAPNFEYGTEARKPAGFGPVNYHWLPRAGHAGTYGAEWEKTRDPLRPRDFSRAYFQCAPEDQQTKSPLVGYETVRLGNFTPDGFWQFVLPRVTFNIVTEFYRRPNRRHDEAAIHTLRIMPDGRRFSVTWLSALPCPFDEERLKITTVSVRPRTGVSAAMLGTGVWSPS